MSRYMCPVATYYGFINSPSEGTGVGWTRLAGKRMMLKGNCTYGRPCLEQQLMGNLTYG